MRLIRKLFAYIEMRSIEIEMSDTQQVITETTNIHICVSAMSRLEYLKGELARARAHFQEFDKPGVRRTWRTA